MRADNAVKVGPDASLMCRLPGGVIHSARTGIMLVIMGLIGGAFHNRSGHYAGDFR